MNQEMYINLRTLKILENNKFELMEAANTSNLKCRKDKSELARFCYHIPDWPSHMFSDAFLDRFIYTDDLFKLTHQTFLNQFSARVLLCESPVGFLVEKCETYLAVENQKTLGIIPGKLPS
jgi:hypothetical protein